MYVLRFLLVGTIVRHIAMSTAILPFPEGICKHQEGDECKRDTVTKKTKQQPILSESSKRQARQQEKRLQTKYGPCAKKNDSESSVGGPVSVHDSAKNEGNKNNGPRRFTVSSTLADVEDQSPIRATTHRDSSRRHWRPSCPEAPQVQGILDLRSRNFSRVARHRTRARIQIGQAQVR